MIPKKCRKLSLEENDSYLPFFQLNSRVFRDMIGTENKLQAGGNVPFITQIRHRLKERMPIVYGSPPRAMVQENEVENHLNQTQALRPYK